PRNTEKMTLLGKMFLLLFVNVSLLTKPIDGLLMNAAFRKQISDQLKQIRSLETNINLLSIQLMAQQFYVEEQTRSNGNSGLKHVRTSRHGIHPYQSASHVDNSLASIHDHANNDRTIGMGELVVVLNGIEFRTRHNDYRLRMKSRSTTNYGEVDDIEFPDVPPEVKQHIDVKDQIEEMRQWFKAWRDQDYSVRDYRPYFKPVLCYLEGYWTHSDQNSIDEPFDSDRHHFDASSWYDLQQKIRFTSYSGGKDGFENFGYLPTSVMKLINGTIPVLAQWNYDILCHPLSEDLPLSRLQPVDDLKARMSKGGLSMNEYMETRAARYRIDTPGQIHSTNWDLLDDLMSEIPGRDNYPGHITDNIFGDTTLPFNADTDEPLNVAYYHRTYRVSSAGAMGLKVRHRGFSDENLFVAQTTQPKVVSLDVESCSKRKYQCTVWEQRWSYAIPLEIIYMTPLSKWNPYDIPYRGDSRTKEGKTIFDGPKGRRNGRSNKNKAYNGTNSKVYYQTPTEFFNNEINRDPADTTKGSTFVLDAGNNVRQVRASGHRIILPNIPDVGKLRQRYPIMPIHGEGDAVWKELEALKDILLEPSKFQQMFRDSDPVEEHVHTIEFETGPFKIGLGITQTSF
ncbi:hypothetical protein LSH36_437g04061, partial [Paralvinella palmiformis]